MRIEGSVTMDRQTYRRVVLSSTRRLWASRILGALVVVCAGVAVVLDVDATSVFLVLVGVLVVLAPNILVAIGWRRLGPAAGSVFHYTVTDSLWSGVARVRATAHTWVVRVDSGGSVPIPRAAFTPDARADIDRFLSTGPFPRVAPSSA